MIRTYDTRKRVGNLWSRWTKHIALYSRLTLSTTVTLQVSHPSMNQHADHLELITTIHGIGLETYGPTTRQTLTFWIGLINLMVSHP